MLSWFGMQTTQTCTGPCGLEKPLSDFYKDSNNPGGHSRQCKSCRSAQNKAYRDTNRARHLAQRKQHYQDNKEAIKESVSACSKRRREADKVAVFGHYGQACACCGEREPLFLSIDHIAGGGNAHRRELFGATSKGSRFYRWLVANGFPPGFQTLCMNCNMGRWRNGGVCPHRPW